MPLLRPLRLHSDELFLGSTESQIRTLILEHFNTEDGTSPRGLWQEEVEAVTRSVLLGQTVISWKLQARLFNHSESAFAIPFTASHRSSAWRSGKFNFCRRMSITLVQARVVHVVFLCFSARNDNDNGEYNIPEIEPFCSSSVSFG